MSTIPTADAALLAAQAEAGQAGVKAYEAAKAELERQRTAAVQQAMQEAALRGSPGQAVQSIAGQISDPYSQRIASLTQNQGQFAADMAARQGRMLDYGQAVQGARGLIGAQTEQAVAPIRAQTEFRIRQLQQAGESRVGEIEANTRLTAAQMASRAQAAQIAAERQAAKEAAALAREEAKKKEEAAKLSGTRLEAALVQGAQDYLNNVFIPQASLSRETSRVTRPPTDQGPIPTAADLAARQAALGQAPAGPGNTVNEGLGGLQSIAMQLQAPSTTAPPPPGPGPGALARPPAGFVPTELLQAPFEAAEPAPPPGPTKAELAARAAAIVARQPKPTYARPEEAPIPATPPAAIFGPQPYVTPPDQTPTPNAQVITQANAALASGDTSREVMRIVAQRLRDQGYTIDPFDEANAIGYASVLKPGMTPNDLTSILAGQPTTAETAKLTKEEQADQDKARKEQEKADAETNERRVNAEIEDLTGIGAAAVKNALGATDTLSAGAVVNRENVNALIQEVRTGLTNGNLTYQTPAGEQKAVPSDKDSWNQFLASIRAAYGSAVAKLIDAIGTGGG